MITVITGKPGSGKTLLAVEMIRDNLKADSIRPIYSNIDGLDTKKTRSFVLDEPDKWPTLPPGSLIIIDEVQDWMPPRPSGRPAPEHVEALNKHRHDGYDIILMTPDPMLMDVTARKAAGRHLHCFRPFGVQHRKVFEWNGINDNPEPSKNEANAHSTKKNFDTTLYDLYKSAEVHTHKRNLPWKKLATLGASVLLAVVFFGYAGYSLVAGKSTAVEMPETGVALQPETSDGPDLPPSLRPPGELSEPVGPPLARYVGKFEYGAQRWIYIELPNGSTVDIADFQAYKIDGFSVLLFTDTDTAPAYRVDDLSLINSLRG